MVVGRDPPQPLPVVIYEAGLGAISHGEGVLGRLAPLDVIDAVRAVVVTGDDDAADQLLGALVLKAEKKSFEEDRASWLKNQFFNLTPFVDRKRHSKIGRAHV